jgi:hypothetical protein
MAKAKRAPEDFIFLETDDEKRAWAAFAAAALTQGDNDLETCAELADAMLEEYRARIDEK